MRRIVASLAVLFLTPGLALAQLNPLSYAPLDSGQGLSPLLTGAPTASIVTTATGGTFTYGSTVYAAVMEPQVGGPDIAVFTFTNINLGGLATALSISGTNPVAILSHQDITMLPVTINGVSGAASTGGAGGVGGSAGGSRTVAGGGDYGGGTGTSGGGAGNGGAGGDGAGAGAGTGGAANSTDVLVGGSGGGGSSFGGGGGGGGALEIGAVNAISFAGSTPISANGGAAAGGAGVGGTAQGGGGAGGFVYIHGKKVTALPTQTFSVNGGNAPNLNGGGGGGGKLIIDGLEVGSGGTPIEPTFVGTNLQAKGGQASNGVNGGAGVIMMTPKLPIVTTYNIVLDGTPVTLDGAGANLGSQLSYVINRDLQVGVDAFGVQPGVARLGTNEPLAPNAKLTIKNSGTFQTGAFRQTVGQLSGTGVLQLDAGGTLGVGGSSTLHLDFDGEIVGVGALEKTGAGTLIRSKNLGLPGTFRNAAGTLAINGATIEAETAFENAAGAEIQLLNLGSSIVSPTFTNLGRVVGTGDVEADLDNQPGGTIRLMESDSQRYLGAVNNNEGVISLLGGTIEFANPVTNAATTGGITGRGTVIVGGAGLTNDGFLAFSGGNTDFLGDVDNTASGQVSTVGGATSSFYGDFVNNGTVRTATGSTTVFLGAQTGGGSFTGGGTVEYFGGAIIPGNSPALVTYGGNVVFGPGSTLQIELGGTVRGAMYDALNIAGNLAAENALEVSLIDGFVPSIGQTFDILNWGSLTGEFTSLSLPALSGAAWDTSQLYADGTLRVVAPTASGDFDGNGIVDGNDLNAWKGGFGKTGGATRAQGDANGDGVVDGSDFLAWQRGVGQSAASTSSAAGVPEPSALILVAGTLGSIAVAARKRSRCP